MDLIVQADLTSFYARDRNLKNRLAYYKFAYKKAKDDCKLEVRLQKKGLQLCEIAISPHTTRLD